jgi:hypothetical protein
MGLDMWVFSTDYKPKKQVDFEIPESSESEELHYWRKHHDLHGWMENLYREKGGIKQEFNCILVQLTKEDIDKLEVDLTNNKLPETTGFFFGEGKQDRIEDDLEFIVEAKRALNEGLTIYYDSWW